MFLQYGLLLLVVKILTKTISLERKSFLRFLPLVFSDSDYQIKENVIFSNESSRRLEIELLELPLLAIGAMDLPQLHLTFKFYGYTDPEIQQFMNCFQRIYQRGGG